MKRLWLLLVSLVWLVLLCGCATPPSGQRLSGLFSGALAGSSDLELTYEMISGGSREAMREELRALVIQRLAATQIGADVEDVPEAESQRNPRIAVIVDEAYASYVDEIMTWTGSLDLFADDPTYALVPGMPDLVRSEEGAYEGARSDVVKALDGWHVDSGHRLLAEPMWSTATRTTPARWRLRVVRAEALDELAEGALIGWSNGPDLRVRGAAGSAAAAIVAKARTRPAPVVARGRVSLGTATFDADGLLLSFGSGAEAYARAQRERRLLASARLPVLKRVDALGLPPNHTLELACLVVPILLSFAWLVFVRRFDRAHPEPMWLIAVTFLLGALSVIPAGLLEVGFASLSPWLDPGLVTFGGQSFAFPLAFLVFTVVVGLSEEGSKFVAAQFAVRRPEFDEPVDGIVYGIVASLGFAAAENIRYFAVGRMSAPLVIARCFMSVPAHMFFGALWGYALGAKLVTPGKRRWAWLLVAAAMHGLFDALLSTDGAGLLAVGLNVGLASVFIVLVRHSLRHGIVTREMLAIRHRGPEAVPRRSARSLPRVLVLPPRVRLRDLHPRRVPPDLAASPLGRLRRRLERASRASRRERPRDLDDPPARHRDRRVRRHVRRRSEALAKDPGLHADRRPCLARLRGRRDPARASAVEDARCGGRGAEGAAGRGWGAAGGYAGEHSVAFADREGGVLSRWLPAELGTEETGNLQTGKCPLETVRSATAPSTVLREHFPVRKFPVYCSWFGRSREKQGAPSRLAQSCAVGSAGVVAAATSSAMGVSERYVP